MPTEGTMLATVLKWPSQDAHDTRADEWETIPRGLDGILCEVEQVPWKGLGKGLNAIQLTLQKITLISGTEWMETTL